MSDRTTIAHSTIAEQRKDLLRQVVFNRAGGIPADQKLLFAAECGLTVHAFSAEFYAAALQELDPVKAEQVAERLAGYLDDGALPEYAWDRAEALGYDPQEWVDEWDRIMVKRGEQLRAPAVELAETAGMRDFHARSAQHLAGKRDRAETAIAAWERGDLAADAALLLVKTALATTESTTSEETQR